jgi:hypothetical protein
MLDMLFLLGMKKLIYNVTIILVQQLSSVIFINFYLPNDIFLRMTVWWHGVNVITTVEGTWNEKDVFTHMLRQIFIISNSPFSPKFSHLYMHKLDLFFITLQNYPWPLVKFFSLQIRVCLIVSSKELGPYNLVHTN